MSEQPQQEQELVIQFAILRRMMAELPETVAQPLVEQLETVLNTLKARDHEVLRLVSAELEDARLDILSMEFDLTATRNERQTLIDKLRDAGLE